MSPRPTRRCTSMYAAADVGSNTWWHVIRNIGRWVADGYSIEIVESAVAFTVRSFTVSFSTDEVAA